MGFNWKEFLVVAKHLQRQKSEDCSEEAFFRCAVSRAYYAVFCLARNYARDNEAFTPTYEGKDHEKIREHFRKKGDNITADRLNELRIWRNLCDYNDNLTSNQTGHLLKNSMIRAGQVIKRLDSE